MIEQFGHEMRRREPALSMSSRTRFPASGGKKGWDAAKGFQEDF
jgi:hypothetical protein